MVDLLDESKVVISQIIIKDMIFTGVTLSGRKCGVSIFFQYRNCNSNFFVNERMS